MFKKITISLNYQEEIVKFCSLTWLNFRIGWKIFFLIPQLVIFVKLGFFFLIETGHALIIVFTAPLCEICWFPSLYAFSINGISFFFSVQHTELVICILSAKLVWKWLKKKSNKKWNTNKIKLKIKFCTTTKYILK